MPAFRWSPFAGVAAEEEAEPRLAGQKGPVQDEFGADEVTRRQELVLQDGLMQSPLGLPFRERLQRTEILRETVTKSRGREAAQSLDFDSFLAVSSEEELLLQSEEEKMRMLVLFLLTVQSLSGLGQCKQGRGKSFDGLP